MRLLTFSGFQEHATPIFKNFLSFTLKDIIKFNILKLIYLYYNDQLQLRIKHVFITNESVYPHNTRAGKLLFIPEVNTTHNGTKLLRYNGPVIWNVFFQKTDDNNNKKKNLCNAVISNFKNYLKDLLISYITLSKPAAQNM